ncbi:unnamed protein product [Blepharisma stoltei]|uniref:Uncharacterized protein n=1 Tax=Blepharisma stoltei TaxID=1481888 RepID=A0AAU9K3F4_9CILI|nr:unnamed protein product [Blepharisma stoltei]
MALFAPKVRKCLSCQFWKELQCERRFCVSSSLFSAEFMDCRSWSEDGSVVQWVMAWRQHMIQAKNFNGLHWRRKQVVHWFFCEITFYLLLLF